MTNFDYNEYYKILGSRVDRVMDDYLPREDVFPEVLAEILRYSVFAGGKRLRPSLLLATVEAFGQNSEPLLPAAAALEFMHTYSLIHDDLPAMDNDDYRRGKLTSHKKFGEAAAILAGDGLMSLAFHALADSEIRPDLLVKMIKELADASGIRGMVAGQMADMYYENKEVNSETLDFIHQYKTAAMIVAPLRMGAISCLASEDTLAALTEFGVALGLAFQVMDDLLDVIGDQEQLGKRPGVDVRKGKATYPALYGVEASHKMVDQQTARAISALEQAKELRSPEYLSGIAQLLAERNR